MYSTASPDPHGLPRSIYVSLRLTVLAAIFYLPVQAQSPGSIVTQAVTTILNSGPTFADSAGNLYTATSVLPPAATTAGVAQPRPGGGICTIISPPSAFPGPCYNAYIAKNDVDGNLIFATYLGGGSNTGASAVAIDSSANLYVAGTAGSPFPTTANAAIGAMPATNTTSASFAAKLSADGSSFLYVTYLPACMAQPSAIAVDPQGNAYIAGITSTTDPNRHVCVVKLSADGSTVVYSKTLAGSNQDSPAASLTADASGDVYVTGGTASPDFPVTAGALQARLAGAQNAFLTKLDPSGNIVFSTYLGGSGKDSGNALRVDSSGNIYLVGNATSLDFPTTAGTYEPQPIVPAYSTSAGGFAAKIAPDGKSIVWATYFPGPVQVVLGPGGDLYVFGGGGPGAIAATPSAPLPCVPGGPLQAGGDLVAHLSASGALLDATWVNQDIVSPAAFGLLPNGSVVLAAGGEKYTITFGGAGWSAPACMTLSALSSATLAATYVVPGELVTFLGLGIGPAAGAVTPGGQSFPTSLGGVQVFFDGTPAPILYAQSGQVNAQAPFELSGQTSTTITLTYGGHTFGPVTVPLNFANPGLFRLQVGLTAQAVAENQDTSLNGSSNPAAPGSVVTLWGTGFPAIGPACPTAGLNPDAAVEISSTYSVVMNGGGTVQYAGAAPTLACGVTQINMQVPLNASAGPLLLTPQVCNNGGLTCTVGLTGAIIYVK